MEIIILVVLSALGGIAGMLAVQLLETVFDLLDRLVYWILERL